MMSSRLLTLLAIILSAGMDAGVEPAAAANPRDDGYRGIWFTLGQKTRVRRQVLRRAGHLHGQPRADGRSTSKEADKTFFVYGGAKQGKRYLLDMVSYYDHAGGVVPRPTIVHDKQGVNDPHDNPSLCIDARGYVWVFVSGRAKRRPGFIYRSTSPTASTASRWSPSARSPIRSRDGSKARASCTCSPSTPAAANCTGAPAPTAQDLDAGPEVRRHRRALSDQPPARQAGLHRLQHAPRRQRRQAHESLFPADRRPGHDLAERPRRAGRRAADRRRRTRPWSATTRPRNGWSTSTTWTWTARAGR